jgi:hypothetical protein
MPSPATSPNSRSPREQLRTSRRELGQVSRQMTVGAMTASIAYEVNQPLAAIVTNAEPDCGGFQDKSLIQTKSARC